MTGTRSHSKHNIWQATRPIVSAARLRTARPARTEQPRLATKTQAEQEADRWVAEMLFDHYNG